MTSVSASHTAALALVALLLVGSLAGTGVTGATNDGLPADAAFEASVASPSGSDDAVASAADVGNAPSASSVTVTDRGGRASVTGAASAVADSGTTLGMTQRLSLTPDRPGSIGVTVSYSVPDSLTTLRTEMPEDATVTGTRGFAPNGSVHEWDEETESPSVTYSFAVNETREVTGPEGADGRYLFVDAGEWALFKRPPVSTTWGWRGGEPVELSRSVETAGPGVAGDWMVYLGQADTRERSAHGQQFRLVVPDRASLSEAPDEILDSLTTASNQLRVGDRDDTVVAFAAPTTAVEWGVRGLQYGEADMWIRDAEELDTVENTWLHEYVHTRQDYETTAATRWSVEGMATYYGAHLAVQQGRAPLSDLGPFLGRGEAPPQSGAVLATPSTWANAANYWKGSLVAGDLDRRIRIATDSERSLQTAFSRLNAHPETVGEGTLAAAVADVGGSPVRDALGRFTTTTAVPEMWSRATHESVFGTTPARVSVGYAHAPDAVSVSGPYRNETLDPVAAPGQTDDGPKVSVYAGETVVLNATVTNAGEVATEYEARFLVDGSLAAAETGPIQPGETVSHTFRRTFERSGSHVLAVGSDELSVAVHDPAEATVTALAANRTRLADPGAVELTATLNNTHAVPARGTLTLTRGEETLRNRTVALGPNAERTVTATTTLSTDGRYTFRAGEADPVVVRVGESANNGGDGDTNPGTEGDESGGATGFGPGPGPVAALVAVLLGAALVARRRD